MMNEQTEKKHRLISGISTTVVTILLLLLLWLYTFSFEKIDLGDEGAVAVAYGDPDAGGPSEVPVEPSYTPPTPSSNNDDNAQEQTDDEEAVATKKVEEIKKKTKPTDKPKVETKTEPKDNALDELVKAKKNQTKQNSGDGLEKGTQGKKDGTGDKNKGGDGSGGSGTGGNGKGVGGVGKGGSVNHSFKGRSFSAGSTAKNCSKAGKVILDVILMPDGTIKYDGVNPSSNGDACLEDAARDILRKSKFNASESPVSVEGTITFNFKLS